MILMNSNKTRASCFLLGPTFGEPARRKVWGLGPAGCDVGLGGEGVVV